MDTDYIMKEGAFLVKLIVGGIFVVLMAKSLLGGDIMAFAALL